MRERRARTQRNRITLAVATLLATTPPLPSGRRANPDVFEHDRGVWHSYFVYYVRFVITSRGSRHAFPRAASFARAASVELVLLAQLASFARATRRTLFAEEQCRSLVRERKWRRAVLIEIANAADDKPSRRVIVRTPCVPFSVHYALAETRSCYIFQFISR